MATKVELETEHQRCEQFRTTVDQAVVERDFATAVQLAASALPHTHASVTYQRRYLKVEQPTTPTIDALLRYAPTLFLGSMLDAVERWYTDGTRTERNALPGLLDQLAQARTVMAIALGMWAKLVAAPIANLRPPTEADYVLRTWIAAGLVIGLPGATSSYRRITDLRREAVGKCGKCGHLHTAPQVELLDVIRCPSCKRRSQFVLSHRVI